MVSVLSRHTRHISVHCVTVYNNSDKMNGNICQGISLLSSAYKILSKTLLSSLTLYINKTIGDH